MRFAHWFRMVASAGIGILKKIAHSRSRQLGCAESMARLLHLYTQGSRLPLDLQRGLLALRLDGIGPLLGLAIRNSERDAFLEIARDFRPL